MPGGYYPTGTDRRDATRTACWLVGILTACIVALVVVMWTTGWPAEPPALRVGDRP